MTAALLQGTAPQPEVLTEQPQPGADVMVPGSPEWLALRRTGIGGSDVAAALGLSPWMSPYELWLDKRGELPAREDNGPMRWGRLLEPLVLQAYADKTNSRVIKPAKTYRSEAHPWMLANLDGLANPLGGYLPATGRVVEAKCARSAEGWGDEGSGDVPQAYLLQVQHYLRVVKLDVADVAVLIGGNDFRVYTVEADRELQDMIVDGTHDFWQRVLREDPPPPDGYADAHRRWGRIAAKGTVIADASDLDVIVRLRDAVEGKKACELEEEALQALVMERLGSAADTLIDAQGRPLVTWKLPKSARDKFDFDLFKADHLDLYQKYATPGTPTRRFLLKPPATTGATS